MTTDHHEAVEAARRIVEANDNRDSFPDGRPQWSKDLENISRAILSLSDRVEEARLETARRFASLQEQAVRDGNEITRLGTRAEEARKTLEHYADQYCEGWCKEVGGFFDDCGGCPARRNLESNPK
jgi:hypothetical protein